MVYAIFLNEGMYLWDSLEKSELFVMGFLRVPLSVTFTEERLVVGAR